MGAVYDAEQLGLGRRVAVKVLHRLLTGDKRELRRFQREAKAAASLSHPHVVEIIDFDDAGPFAYLVMEHIAGRSLAQIFDTEAPLAEPRVVGLALHVLSALGAAHGAGVIHRDLKPHNVMVTVLPDAGEWVKLVDFGIARMTEGTGYTRLTQSGLVVGTPSIMAPEQALGRPLDYRVDIYGAGALIHRLLSGGKLFPGENVAEILEAIVSQSAPRLRESRPDVSPALDAVVNRALEKDPSLRPQSAAAMAEELRAAVGAVPQTPSSPHPAAGALIGPTMSPATVGLGGHSPTPSGATALAPSSMANDDTMPASTVPVSLPGLALPPTSPQGRPAPAPAHEPAPVEPRAQQAYAAAQDQLVTSQPEVQRTLSPGQAAPAPPPVTPYPAPRRSKAAVLLYVALGVAALLALAAAGAVVVALWLSGDDDGPTSTRAGEAAPTVPVQELAPPATTPAVPPTPAPAATVPVTATPSPDVPPPAAAISPSPDAAPPQPAPTPDAATGGGSEANQPAASTSRSSDPRRRRRRRAEPPPVVEPSAPPPESPRDRSGESRCRTECHREHGRCRMDGGDGLRCIRNLSECQRACSLVHR